jgi:hypothetical protein
MAPRTVCGHPELRLDGGIAVASLNGCGKSNLSDAISWVPDETSIGYAPRFASNPMKTKRPHQQ